MVNVQGGRWGVGCEAGEKRCLQRGLKLSTWNAIFQTVYFLCKFACISQRAALCAFALYLSTATPTAAQLPPSLFLRGLVWDSRCRQAISDISQRKLRAKKAAAAAAAAVAAGKKASHKHANVLHSLGRPHTHTLTLIKSILALLSLCVCVCVCLCGILT